MHAEVAGSLIELRQGNHAVVAATEVKVVATGVLDVAVIARYATRNDSPAGKLIFLFKTIGVWDVVGSTLCIRSPRQAEYD